jgi:uncharacterized protein YdhG (YjbR/CyaY superfamily)
MASKPTTIDQYLAAVRQDQRGALQKLRDTIRAVVPDAEECISYQIPSFRLDGVLVGFGAAARHCAFYLCSASTVKQFEQELRRYDTSQGTIRFAPDKPLPVALVRKLVRARVAENRARRAQRTGSQTAAAAQPTVESVVALLKRSGKKSVRDGMARFAIPSDRAFGMAVGDVRAVAKRLGRSHVLAAELWKTQWYEARLLATFVDEPERVTAAQMDRWAKDFDNWAICDTACFHLRRAFCPGAEAGGTSSRGRPQLRQEIGELGVALDWQA